MKKLFIFSTMLMAFASGVKAQDAGGLFVEPMLTWERGRGDLNLPTPFSNAETELDGFGVGARLGGHVWESVFVAVDGRYSMPSFKDNKINQDVDAKAWNVGPVVGVQMPTLFGLRVWGGWIVAGEADPEKGQNVDVRFESGSGYRVGAGIKMSVVSLNVEYQKIKYSETRFESLGPIAANDVRQDSELENDSMVLSVSFPLAI